LARTLPASTAEQRLSLWADLESLLYPGFLSARIRVDGISLCIRQPAPSDLWLVNQYADPEESLWVETLLTQCVWAVEGINILGDRRAHTPVRSAIRRLPAGARSSIFYAILGLLHRTRLAQEGVYSFVYESSSRDLWKSRGARWPVDDSLSGVPGSASIGPNQVQMVWAMWNEAEDMRLRDRWDWHITKNLMACHAGKAVRKIDASDKREAEKTDRDRQKSLDQWYYRQIGVIDDEGRLVGAEDEEGHDGVTTAHTSAELADEMRRWVEGQDDWHDRVIRKYKTDIREGMARERELRMAHLDVMRSEAERRSQELGGEAPAVVGYTLDQIKTMMAQKGYDLDKPHVRKVEYGTGGRNRSYDKWIASELDSGALVIDDGGDIVAAGEIPRPRKDTRSLDEQLAERLPRTPGGGD
jgi:hypothetical protein